MIQMVAIMKLMPLSLRQEGLPIRELDQRGTAMTLPSKLATPLLRRVLLWFP